MDNLFPDQLFPQFYHNGPPEAGWQHNCGGWGSYGRILRRIRPSVRGVVPGQVLLEFQSQHEVEGDMWIPVEPAVMPLLPPNDAGKIHSGRAYDPKDFPEHMQHFYVHHCMDSFSTMGRLLEEHFHFSKNYRKDCVAMGRLKKFLAAVNYKKCELAYAWKRTNRYSHLLKDVLSDVPASLLAELLHEELTVQRELENFQPATTGGALCHFSFPESFGQGEGCLIYPSGKSFSTLNFHPMVLEYDEDRSPRVEMKRKPLIFTLKGQIRQISVADVGEVHVGVRSDHFCGSWDIKPGRRPRPLEVIQLKERCCCLNVSPHVSGELVVTSESGAAYHWIVGNGLLKFREEQENLYFRTSSAWRWCEFSAHPRVTVYADRTGAELTDMRTRNCSHTLFRIGKTSDCRSGERVFLAKHLHQGHPYHHLITTQVSAYVLDERMPCVPALKWDHLMDSPPCFAQVLPALGSSTTSKILLGAQRKQETVLLQYSGGRRKPCMSRGPVQKLYSPCESLKIRQLPHRQHKAEERLAVPAAGLTVTQRDGVLSVFQLTEAGDLFCQMLKLHSDPSQQSHSVDVAALVSPYEKGRTVPVWESWTCESSDSEYAEDLRSQGTGQPDAEETGQGAVPELFLSSSPLTRDCPVRPASPQKTSRELTVIWKEWLSALLKPTQKKRRSQHRRIRTRGLIRLRHTDLLVKDRFLSLRRDFAEARDSGKLLLHGGTNLPSLEVTPVPNEVDPSDWPDELSQRLSASWGDGWRNWWEEKLGLNRDTKISALRKRRRKEKQARARNRMQLSGSFTASISYTDDLSGWSSSMSQFLGSDSESLGKSQSLVEDGVAMEPEVFPDSPAVQGTSSSATTSWPPPAFDSVRPSRSSQSRTEATEQDRPVSRSQDQASVVETAAVSLKTSLSSQQDSRQRQQQDYLSSLFGSQEPSQLDDSAPSVCTGATRSQLSSLSFPLHRPSQKRTSSHPQRKKSRMGF